MKRSTDKTPALASTAARSRLRRDTQVPVAPPALVIASPPARPVPARAGVGARRSFRPGRGPLAGSRQTSGRHLRGLTLIELLVALSIATLVLTLGVTGMTQMVAQNRRVAEVNTLMGNLNFARAEAVFRMTDVTVCPIDPANPANGTCNVPTAGANSIQWDQGYIVVVDATGERLRVQDRTGSVRITSQGAQPCVTFGPDGSLDEDLLEGHGDLALLVCDRRDQSTTDEGRGPGIVAPRVVTVTPIGRVRVSDQYWAQVKDSDTTVHNPIDCSTGTD